MKFKTVKKESFTLFGVSTDVYPEHNGSSIGELWKRCFSDGTSERMAKIAGYKPGQGEFGSVCYDYNPESQSFRYMLTAMKAEKAIPEDFEQLTLPEQTWGVFYDVYEDHEDIHILWDQWQEYINNSEYTYTGGPQMEQYHVADKGTLCEVWIPIRKK